MLKKLYKCSKCKKELKEGEQPCPYCGHTGREIVMSVTENLSISENAEYELGKDPVAEIRKAIENNDYSKIVILACSAFEKYGKEILVWHLKENPNKTVIIILDTKNKKNLLKLNHENASNKLKDLHVVIDALALCEIVTDDDATKMHCIRQLRNNFLHRGSLFKLSSRIVKKINALNDDIIYYIGFIKGKYDTMAPPTI